MSTMSPLPSLQLWKNQMISKWDARISSQEIWTLSQEQQEAFSKYYLLYWSPKHFFREIHDGTLTHQKVSYLVYYHQCTVDSCKRSRQVALSFRVPKPTYDLPAIVLVSASK